MRTAQKELVRFLERGYMFRSDRLLKLLHQGIVTSSHWHLFEEVKKKKAVQSQNVNTLAKVAAYEGINKTALKIGSLFGRSGHKAVVAALVHGSIGSSEETAYSDFDGVLIIDPQRIDSRKEARALVRLIRKSEALMLEQDSLQHHGWSILLKSELLNYPDDELPFVLIRNSRSLYPLQEVMVQACIHTAQMDYKRGLQHLLQSVARKNRIGSFASDMYCAKQYFSELLLLPALYLQARYNEPIWKKDSFTRIQHELEAEHLELIAEISAVRERWGEQPSPGFRLRLIHQLRIAGLRFFNMGRFPDHLKIWLEPEQRLRVEKFCARLGSV